MLLQSGRAPQIYVRDRWVTVKEHPTLQLGEMDAHLREVIGSKKFEDLENGMELVYGQGERRFVFSMQENKEGKVLLARTLKVIPTNLSELKEFPEIEAWIRNTRGIYKVSDPAIYAGILRHFSQSQNSPVVSLERLIKYPADSFTGLISQKELGEHFETLEEGLSDALQLKPALIGICELNVKTSDFVALEKIAGERLLLLCACS